MNPEDHMTVLEVNNRTEVLTHKDAPLIFELKNAHQRPVIIQCPSATAQKEWVADLREMLPLVTKSTNNLARARVSIDKGSPRARTSSGPKTRAKSNSLSGGRFLICLFALQCAETAVFLYVRICL
jgi:hypothetical protein